MQSSTPRVNISKRQHLELEYTTNIRVITIMGLKMKTISYTVNSLLTWNCITEENTFTEIFKSSATTADDF